LPAFNDFLCLADQLGMIGEILIRRSDDLALRDVLGLEALRLERSLDGLDRSLSGQDPGRHAHACAELGL
jgi:hypothetical protein